MFVLPVLAACEASGNYNGDIENALAGSRSGPRAEIKNSNMVLDPAEPAPRPYLRIKNRNPAGYSRRVGIPYLFTLGELAFRSPLLFGGQARKLGLSCRNCHPNGHVNARFFIPGNSSVPGTVDVSHVFFGRGSENGIKDPVRIPSLRGVRFRAPYGHDGRSRSLREFTRHVIRGEFGGGEPSAVILDALETYLREFEFLPNPRLDPRGRPGPGATANEMRGERLFRASCARCHPPGRYFRDGLVHRVGTKPRVSPWAVEGGVKTPTLLGMENKGLFHDASAADATAAILRFNKRLRLGFGKRDVRALTAYMRLVAAVEKPLDERGPGERLLELVGTLRFFESALETNRRFSTRIYDFFLASLVIDFIREMKNLRLEKSRRAAHDVLRDLRRLHTSIRGGVSPGDARRALRLEQAARNRFSRMIMR